MNRNIIVISCVLSLAANGILAGKLLLNQEESGTFKYAFRIARARTHLTLGMSRQDVEKLVGSEADVLRADIEGTRCTWSTAYKVGPITRLLYDPAPHGLYLEALFDRDGRLVDFRLDET